MAAKVRPARNSDAALGIVQSGQYWVMEDEQGVVAWGGVQLGIPPLAVMWTADRATDYPVGLGRICRKVRGVIKALGRDVYAWQDEAKPTAAKFLKWMGFAPIETTQDGRILHIWTG
tara:strand:- start:2873 stop:3223 length:351 start_codon:yes stop_codon:yes gene_type:complete